MTTETATTSGKHLVSLVIVSFLEPPNNPLQCEWNEKVRKLMRCLDPNLRVHRFGIPKVEIELREVKALFFSGKNINWAGQTLFSSGRNVTWGDVFGDELPRRIRFGCPAMSM